MAIKIRLTRGRTRSTIEAEASCTIAGLLARIGVNRETVLVRLNGEVAVEEETLRDGDEVEIITAVSGG
ncbi:MAG: MoaD/ThiS family protein [Candidatus Hydrothermarchaeaceae archaeon]